MWWYIAENRAISHVLSDGGVTDSVFGVCPWHRWAQLRVRASIMLWAWKARKERAIPTFHLLSHVVQADMWSPRKQWARVVPELSYFNTFPLAALLEILGYSMYFPLPFSPPSPFLIRFLWFHFAPNSCMSFTVFGVRAGCKWSLPATSSPSYNG